MRNRSLIVLLMLGVLGCSASGAQTGTGGTGGGQAGTGGGQAGGSGGQAGAAAGSGGSAAGSGGGGGTTASGVGGNGAGGAAGAAGSGGSGGATGSGGAAGRAGNGGVGGTTASGVGGGGTGASGAAGFAGAGGSAGATGAGGAAGQAGSEAPHSLSLLAGGLGGPGDADGTGVAARFNLPGAIACDGAGSCYLTDATGTVRKIVVATGAVTTLAGASGQPGSADGTGAAAQFSSPSGVAYDGAGNLFIADTFNRAIRKIVIATGAVTTLAGSPNSGGIVDGTGKSAGFVAPVSIAADGAGNLFVADAIAGDIQSHFYLRKVVIATAAVTTTTDWLPSQGDQSPGGIALDGAGNLYLLEDNVVRRINLATGAATTFAGSGSGSADGTGAAAGFNYPGGIASDGAGNLYVTDSGNGTIRKIVIATGAVTTLAGTAGRVQSGTADGIGATARFNSPGGIAVDSAGDLVVSDSDTIRKIVIATSAVTTLAGATLEAGSTDGTGAAARFSAPDGIASDGAGNVFVADDNNGTIRQIVVATGAVTTLAGTPGQFGNQDGIGAAASFNRPLGIASDGAGNVFVADGIIRKIVVATRAVTTLTNGPGRDPGDPGPAGLASDGAGNLYFANAGTTIWKVSIATGALTAVAGTAGKYGSADGTGAAARFNAPSGIASDGAGNLFVADGNTIRKIVIASRVVTTLAGTSGQPGSADGTGAAARFTSPSGIASDGAGNLFVADGNTIRKIAVATKTVSTVVGVPGQVGVSLGALPASLNVPGGVVVLPTGELAIVDTVENAVLIARF